MEKENRIPLPRRRSGSDGPAPTGLATSNDASDGGPAGNDTTLGQDEEGKTGKEPGTGHGGMGSAEDGPGPDGARDRAGGSSELPRRVRGMTDGPRPPAQVARPALPASFLERVRAAAEAEQRLEEQTQERAGQPAEPPAAGPEAAPRRPARFIRSRDWMARNEDKKERGAGDQPGPDRQAAAAAGQSGPASPATPPIDLWTAREGAEPDQPPASATLGARGTDGTSAGRPELVGPGAPPEQPRRKPRVSHRRDPVQPGPVAATSTVGHTDEASTEPIPVIRVPPAGEPWPPEGVGQGSPAPGGTPVTAAVQAPDQAAAPSPVEPAVLDRAGAEQAPMEQVPAEQVPEEQAPVARDVAPATPGLPLGHSRRSRGKGGLRARVARGMAAAPRPPAGPEDPERQDAGRPASQPAREEAAAREAAAAADASAAPEVPAPEDTTGEPEATGQAAGDQAARDQAARDQAAGDQAAADQAAADQAAAERQAQQAAARRVLDEVIVQRAAAVLARKSSPAWTRRRVGLAAVVVALGGVAVGIAFLGSGGHQGQGHRPHSGPVPTAAVNRDRAAAWVASQVSPGTTVSCDPVTCALIESHGFRASHVRILGPGKGNPLVSNVVVATPAIRRQFGAELTSVYAPGLLATFGSGSRQVNIQLVAPHGAPAYRAALKADLQSRRQSGAGLSGSNRIQAPITARKQLRAGQVDSRLMITLALMASLHPVHLVTFGDGGPDLDLAPLRSAKLSVTGSVQKEAVLTFLHKEQPPYQPTHVTTKPMGGGQTLLILEFTAPSPVGLFH
jgi:hypothetical protein